MIRQYLSEPKRFWPETHYRNATKIDRFLYSGCESKHKKEMESYIENIINLGHLREKFSPKHLYLVNAGSSGSHWIEAMLGLLPNFYNSGEVYIPSKIINYLTGLTSKQANVMLDIIYLVHTGGIYKDSLTASLSNSAHLADHEKISCFSSNKVTVLLLRNPVDVAISRTFRKNEYKEEVAPTLSDKEYLEKNCVYIENFYKGLNMKSFDAVIRYEDFIENTFDSLQSLAGLIEIKASDEDVNRAVEKTSQKEEKNMLDKKGTTLTNIYMGEKNNYAWAKSYVSERLNDILVTHKYN